MRILSLALCLLLAGCSANEAEFAAVQLYLERQLAEKYEIAQNLNKLWQEMDQLEERLAVAEAKLPPGSELRLEQAVEAPRP